MSYVIRSGSRPSSLAIGAGSGAVGFALLAGSASQPTGRGYAVNWTDVAQSGPIWGKYMLGYQTRPRVGKQKLITTVSAYVGKVFPPVNNYNKGFPFTTGTVLARATGTAGGQKRDTTLTAKGGDTVTGMGKRNISLVAGGMARMLNGPRVESVAEIAQLYVPEPGRSVQLLAGALGLLAIAAARRRGR